MSRVFVLCPDYPEPSGGIRRLYRHVDVLNQHGFDALVLHTRPGFRCEWFANQTRVDYAGAVIALWLGHESTETTHQYVEADVEMKRRVLDRLDEPAWKVPRRSKKSDLLDFLDRL